jgi:FkbM family methyltransferase
MNASYFLKLAYDIDFYNLNILECGGCGAGETLDLIQDNNCYYIEANPTEYENLKQITNNGNVSFLALTDNNDSVEFLITSHSGNSSISHSNEHMDELINIHKSTFSKCIVPATTYKNYIENVIKTNIDILILDIEGHEYTVLKTFNELNTEQFPSIICIECGYDWNERKRILLELGYVLDFYQYNNCYLSHISRNIKKNSDIIKQINIDNPNFVWFGKTIYENNY